MNYDSFLIDKRWEILSFLAENPASPLEISKKLGTTVSYVSQQLKLLELAGFVSKFKTGMVEKGKPRNVYSVDKTYFSFIYLDSEFAMKKQLSVDIHKKAILKIWSLKDSSYHIPLESFFLGMENDLGKIEGIFVKEKDMKVFVITGSKEVENKVSRVLKTLDKNLNVVVLGEPDSTLFSHDCISIYGSKNLN